MLTLNENKHLVCDIFSYRSNSALQNFTDLNCHSFIINPTLKVVVILKYWHEAVENFCNELHDENCSIVFQHSQAQSVLWSIESQSINLSEFGRRVLRFFLCVFFPTGTAVAQAQAQHPDGTRDGITYTIFSGNKYRSFSISSSTGQMARFWQNAYKNSSERWKTKFIIYNGSQLAYFNALLVLS